MDTSYSNDIIKFCHKKTCEAILYNRIATSFNNPQISQNMKYSSNIRTYKKTPVSYEGLLAAYACAAAIPPTINVPLLLYEKQFTPLFYGNRNNTQNIFDQMNTNSLEINETTDTFSNNLNLNNINTRQGSSLFIPKNTSEIFKYPNSVAFDQLGNIYVGNSNQIIKINKNNKNKSIIAEGFQNNTLDIAVNYTGTYLYATSGSRLIRMNTNGKNRVILSPIFNYLYGVAVNETGNVFVTDTNEIKIMDSNGVLGLVIGYCDFYHLYGINIYKNSIYVVSNYIDNKDGVIEFYNQLLVFNLPSNVNLSEKITVELNENDITQIAGKLPEQVGFHLFNGDTIYISDFYGIYYLT